jgi:hypothetical protein
VLKQFGDKAYFIEVVPAKKIEFRVPEKKESGFGYGFRVWPKTAKNRLESYKNA